LAPPFSCGYLPALSVLFIASVIITLSSGKNGVSDLKTTPSSLHLYLFTSLPLYLFTSLPLYLLGAAAKPQRLDWTGFGRT